MYRLNVSKHLDVSNYLNLNESRKKDILEYLYPLTYIEKEVRLKVIVCEIFYDIIDKGLNPAKNIKLLFNDDIDILNEIENEFNTWDIEIEIIK